MNAIDQNARIALRLKTLREERKLTQAEFASAMGIENRQTIASIEAGERRVDPGELVRAAEVLGVDLDTFLDPYRLVGEAQFSFRAREVAPAVLAEFENQAGCWIATYRELASRFGLETGLIGLKLKLSEQSSFEEAAASAETLWAAWELGDVPAARLEDAIERHLGAIVLYVDAPEGISGAATHLPRYDTILVNRNEPASRRSFDLAHELFHILTWDAMPPKRVEPQEVRKSKGNRVEYLAENFAAALLMPSAVVRRRWEQRESGGAAEWVSSTASELRVSAQSLTWRLVNLGLLTRGEAESLRNVPRSQGVPPGQDRPLLFSSRFVALVARAVNEGRLSLRRAAGLLQLRIVELGELCAAYGHPLTYDLQG